MRARIWHCVAAVFLAMAIGAIVSVLVAHLRASGRVPAGISRHSLHTHASGVLTYAESRRGALDIYQFQTFASSRSGLDFREMTRQDFERALQRGKENARGINGQEDVDYPPPDDWHGWVADSGEPVRTFDVVVVGWPWRCMYVMGVNAGSPVTVDKTRSGAMDSSLPRWPLPKYRALWPGMLQNTALFGSPVLAWIVARTALRPWWWRRRGRCGRCGYDLRGSLDGCPECGAGIARVSVS